MTTKQERNRLAIPTVLLLAVATLSNLYLGHLYVRVNGSSDPAGVSSFCNFNEQFNCVEVAASRYASIGGVPTAFWGAEFYGVLTLLVIAAIRSGWPLRCWQGCILSAMIIALPFSAWLAYVSYVKIQSVCVLCSVVYAVNIILLFLLLVVYRGQSMALMKQSFSELWASFHRGATRFAMIGLVTVVVSQVFWVPSIMGKGKQSKAHAETSLKNIVMSGMTAGPQDAPIRIEEFSDFQCPVCSVGHRVMVGLLSKFPKQIHFVHHDFPLDQACNRQVTREFHRYACGAAYFARCASYQRKFWPFAALLFHNQDALTYSKMRGFAKRAGLDSKKLSQCLNRASTKQAVLDDVELGIQQHVEGTPTFFVGHQQNGQFVDRKSVLGPREMTWWENTIKALLKHKEPKKGQAQ